VSEINSQLSADAGPAVDAGFRERLQAHLATLSGKNVRLNALVDVFTEDALNQAQRLDEKHARGESLGPLAGMTVSVKANIDVKGHVSTHGIRALQDNVVDQDAPLVARLREADAVILGHANMPDMSMRFHTASQLYGATQNCIDASLTPGGSSGGDAVSVGSGMTTLGLGNDAGGSVRIPASFAGVCALKPTTGRFASDRTMGRDLPFAAQVIPVDGLIATTVTDLARAHQVFAGVDVRDPRSLPVAAYYMTPLRKRIALVRDPGNGGVAEPVVAALARAEEILRRAGFDVVECQPPAFDKALELYGRLIMTEFSQSWPLLSQLVGDDVRRYLEFGLANTQLLTLREYIAAVAERMNVQREWHTMLAQYDAILGPVFCERIPVIDADIVSKESNETCGRAMRLCSASSLVGVPAVSVSMRESHSLPVGVQFICAPFQETKALTLARVLERQWLPDTTGRMSGI